MKIRLFGGRDPFEGRVEVQLEETGLWGPICGDGWGVREAMVRGFVTKNTLICVCSKDLNFCITQSIQFLVK